MKYYALCLEPFVDFSHTPKHCHSSQWSDRYDIVYIITNFEANVEQMFSLISLVLSAKESFTECRNHNTNNRIALNVHQVSK